jgi:hypothetical protein
MGLYLGGTDIEGASFYLGSSAVSGLYLGGNLLFPSTDPDAQAFITATGISGTDADAINQLVLDLKSYSLWDKMLVIYPFIGGTSTTNSYNLKDTSTFQITWFGTVTHSTNGVQGDGVTGYGETGFVPSVVNATTPITTSFHGSAYSRTAATNSGAAYGVDSGVPQFQMLIKRTTGNFLSDNYTEAVRINVPYADTSQGLFVSSRTSQTLVTDYRNTTSLATNTGAVNTTALPTIEVFVLGANFFGSAVDYETRQIAWESFGTGLDSTDVSNLYTAVQAYQTALGRQV